MTLEQFLSQKLRGGEAQGEEYKAFCPFHTEERPSFSVNLRTGAWRCFSGPVCGGGRSIKSLCKKLGVEIPQDLTFTPAQPVQVEPKYVPLELVREKAAALIGPDGGGPLQYLKKRGITEEAIREHAIGWDQESNRIWFPIFDRNDRCVQVKLYDWTKTQPAKFLNYGARSEGYAGACLWPSGVVETSQEVYLFAGEPDCLLAHSLGIKSGVTSTAGEGSWNDSFTAALAGKTVFILYDIDGAGVSGASRIAHALRAVAKGYCVRLPITEPKNGDFTDYVLATSATAKDVVDLCQRAVKEEAKKILLGASAAAEVFGKPVALRAAVAGRDQTPYMVPKTVVVRCNPRDDNKVCHGCPLMPMRGDYKTILEDGSYPMLSAVFSSTRMVEQDLKTALGIPLRCPGHTLEQGDKIPLWDIRLINDLDSEEGREDGQFVARRAFTQEDLQANVPYDFDALATLDPKTQRSLLYIRAAQSAQSGLDSFTIEGKEHLLKLWEA